VTAGLDLAGRVALVTGAGSGIGAATAVALGVRGAAVAVTDVNVASARAVAKRITAAGGMARAVHLDVSDEESVASAFSSVAATEGSVSLVAHAAGILHIAPAIDTTSTDFDRVLAVNLRGTFLVNLAAARAMIRERVNGAIVNISSIHAVLSEPNAAAYTAAKGGVEAMTRTFASEWAEHGIRVNIVRPGATYTALTADIYTPEVLAALALRVPMGRPAQPEEIASAVLYLLSPESSYLTGTAIDVDGGYIMNGALPRVAYERPQP
jgi:NAD(P)-dependent dehydrogenase (short-subunit alcohol dehydrogenase family)